MTGHAQLKLLPGPDSVEPFLKWPGGKRKLARLVADLLRPSNTGTYWEPFCGAGGVYFKYPWMSESVVLSDLNAELICAFKAVQTNVEGLVCVLEDHMSRSCEEYYYSVRSSSPVDPVLIAARMIYLNKTGFNGLYRVQSEGVFNVSYGFRNPEIDMTRLREASKALAGVTLLCGDFEEACQPSHGDKVFLDPPYDGGFTQYVQGGFSRDDQRRVASFANRIADQGASVVVCNSGTDFIKELYEGWDVVTREQSWMIGHYANQTPQSELLFYRC